MIELEYADTPPSLNRLGSRSSHWAVRDAKKLWQGVFEGLLLASGLPRGQEAIHATASLRFPVRRPRDEGNFRWLGLEKALGDALTNGGWLLDDDASRFTFGKVLFEDERGPKRTIVRLECQARR